MAGKKPIEGEMSESDIEFFLRELESREPSQLTLITGTGDEAQKVLRDMINAGASIQDGKLSEKHDSNIDESKMKIEQTIRIEVSLAQGSAMPGMTLRARRGQKEQQIDLTFAGDLEIDSAKKELKKAIDTSGLQECIDETFQESDFSAKQFCTTHYPEKSRPYLDEAEFYCRKAREYRAKGQIAATQARNYDEQRKNVSKKIEKEHSEVFSYCIQEAVYWKLKAEIYNNSEQDKKRIQDPTKSSSCNIHSENYVTKFVYIPTDRRNIDENIDLELIKVGLGVRYGVNSVMLVVKKIEECKEQNTLDMLVLLGIYGAPFQDRGIIMVTEGERNTSKSKDVEYFQNKTSSEEYLDIIKLIANENRFFLLDSKRLEQNKLQTKIQEFFQFKLRVTKGEKLKNDLSEIGRKLYGEIAAVDKGLEFHVNNARGTVDELRVCDKALIEFKNIQEFFRKQLSDIETCLNNCKNKDHPDYLQAMKRYEVLNMPTEKKPFYEDNARDYLVRVITAMTFEKSKLADATILTKDISANLDPSILQDNRNNGMAVGAVIGVIGGPIGMAVGAAIGGAIGEAVGGVSGIGAYLGYTRPKEKPNPKK